MNNQETPEQIKLALDTAGVSLYFNGNEVKAIPGQRIALMADYHSIYDVEKQNYTFQLSTQDIVTHVIEHDTPFSYITDTHQYDFEVRSPKPDMTGWTKIDADLITITKRKVTVC